MRSVGDSSKAASQLKHEGLSAGVTRSCFEERKGPKGCKDLAGQCVPSEGDLRCQMSDRQLQAHTTVDEY